MRKLKLAILVALILTISSFNLFGRHQDPNPKKKIFVDYQLGILTD
jgi:hypothetical protein